MGITSDRVIRDSLSDQIALKLSPKEYTGLDIQKEKSS